MRKLIICSLFLVGCSYEYVDAQEESVDYQTPQESYGEHKHGSPTRTCGNAYQTVAMKDNGTDIIFTVPLPCNPFYVEKGRPPEKGYDRNPVEEISNPPAKQY